MTIQAVPYFSLPGTAREAMEFYHSIFGGELTAHTFGEFHAVEEGDPATDYIMHTSIVGGVVTLGASDYDPRFGGGKPHEFGNALSVSLWGNDVDEGRRYFEALAEGGTIATAFEPQVWGASYGELTDKFGVTWSVNVAPQMG
ncbi:VOC family protein [Gulosibacter macacae]|uniref:VOC family protein n=1 Tax=Gulosibacter macacae TaxID=2488791 RepID=A0A3P3VVF3_9MICO|nr:VOC family protein [Gulosibacter macacae]RRJ86792.1 VOC family protein [Gulosibacter macacae]